MKNAIVSSFLVWSSFIFTRDITVAWVGVPLNVMFACAVGTAASFAVAERIESPRRMWGLAFGAWFMGCAFTALVAWGISTFTEWKMQDGAQAGMGAVVSFVTRFALPWIAELARTGKWTRWIPFLKKGEE